MKKLGIIGGAGPLASALFYETLVHECYRIKRLLPEILIINYPFHRGLTPKESEENGPRLSEQLDHCRTVLKKGGATHALLLCNTLHRELAKLDPKTLPFFSLPEMVAEKIKEKNVNRLLLLATKNTCNSTLYKKSGITLFYPSEEDQRVIDHAIDHILEGRILKEDSRLIEEVIDRFSKKIEGVILGCTDLSVLNHHFPIPSKKALFDSVTISAKTIMRFL